MEGMSQPVRFYNAEEQDAVPIVMMKDIAIRAADRQE